MRHRPEPVRVPVLTSEPCTRSLSRAAAAAAARSAAYDVRRHAVRALVDWMGCVIAGAGERPAAALRKVLAGELGPASAPAGLLDAPAGSSRLYPQGALAPPRAAALINGTAAHVIEADDIHRDGIVHPGAPVIAATLAVVQAERRTAVDLLRGLVAGYEVTARVAVALGAGHYRLWHVTGTAGALGAAAGVGAALDLDEEAAANALATAATFAGGLQAALAGASESKPLHAGRAAEAGLVAACLAREGLLGAPAALEGPGGLLQAMAADGDAGVLRAADSDVPAITRVTFKSHLCCGHSFAAIDAALELVGRHGLDAGRVDEVVVSTYRAALDVAGNRDAKSARAARFSLPYVVAHALLFGSVRLDAFSDDRLADARLRDLAGRVQLRLDPGHEAAFPGGRGATVSVRTSDGEVVQWTQPHRRGDPEAPVDDEEVDTKFIELAAPVMGETEAVALLGELRAVAATIPAAGG